MSTGLTYLLIWDNDAAQPDRTTSITIFNDYNEAYDYGRWYMDLLNTDLGQADRNNVLIYTTTPNDSGYWRNVSGVNSFVIVD